MSLSLISTAMKGVCAVKIPKLIVVSTIFILTLTSAAHADVQVWPEAGGQIAQNNQPIQTMQPIQNGSCGCLQMCAQHASYLPAPVYVIVQQQTPPPPPPQRTVVGKEDRTVYFGFNKANLTADSRDRLNSLANRLMSADDVTGAKIVGYADRIGSVSYNQALSERRAEHVRDYLINRGFVKPSVTETRWVGKSEPSTSCSKYLPRAQLIRCLQPDRKVEVDINYRAEVQAER